MATEKRLIDAIELSNRLCKVDAQNRNDGLILADNEVWKMPVVDAVEVVYCKDCARRKKGYCTIRKDSWGATLLVGEHDFCSDGERRTDV